MPVSKPMDLPVGGGEGSPLCGSALLSARWGGMEVGYPVAGPVNVSRPRRAAPETCRCPHYFSGRLC
jgi:hypothetical protein